MDSLNNIEIKFDHWVARPLPFRYKPNYVYARVLGNTIYFDKPAKHILQKNEGGDFIFRRLFRHELEHIYQKRREKFFSLKYAWEFISNLYVLRNPLLAYEENKYELDAVRAESIPLTTEEYNLFNKHYEGPNV